MKNLLTVAGALLLSVLAAAAADTRRIAIDSQSAMVVRGGSTVHDWHATVATVDGHIDARLEDGQVTAIDGAVLTVAVADMDAKNGTMNSKMRAALKAEEHPEIRYVLDSAEVVADSHRVVTQGLLTVAGATRQIATDVELHRADDGTFQFEGAFAMVMTDFGIRPPTAMFGALRTHDEVRIEFLLTGHAENLQADRLIEAPGRAGGGVR